MRMMGEGSARGRGWVDGEAVWGRGWHVLELVDRTVGGSVMSAWEHW